MSPKTSSRCSPSPSWSLMVRIRTGVLNMRISAMPAQVFLNTVVGGELIANAVTSEIESQQVEIMPFKKSLINVVTFSWGGGLKGDDT